MSAAEEEEQRSLNGDDHSAGKDNMRISQAVSVSFSHSAASGNSVDNDNENVEDTSHANTDTSNNLAPNASPPCAQESAAVGLKSVMPSFRTTLNNDEDDETSSPKNQQQHSMAPLPLTQHNPDDSGDDDNNSDMDPSYASSSSSDGEHGDDDGSDSDSDDESHDGDSPDVAKSPNPMFTDAARAQRVLRNKNMQIELGLVQRSPQPGENHQNNNSPMVTNSPSEAPTPRPLLQQQAVRGMVFSTPYNNNSHAARNAALKQPSSLFHEEDAEDVMLEELEKLYPHRQAQIMQLWSLLSPCLPPMINSTDSSISTLTFAPSATPTMTHHVPPPIFITGPAGTGKSTLVRDLVGRLQASRSTQYHYPQQPHRVGSAYINCATLDRRNSNGKAVMDEILHEAYRQLAQDMKESGRVLDYASWRRRRKRKRKSPKRALLLVSSAKNAATEPAGWQAPATKENNDSSSKRQRCESGDAASTKEADASRTNCSKEHVDVSITNVGGKEEEEKKRKVVTHAEEIDEFPKLRRSRRVSELADADDDNNFDANGNIKEQTVKSGYNNKAKKLINAISSDLDATATAAAKDGDLTAVTTAASRTAHIAAASFGQELKETLFRHTKDCAFLILDQAEQLLSVPASSSAASAKTNFLAQLLLLPRTKGLNLTIIVITKSIVLEHSRFNNLIFPDKSLSTLSTALQPLHIHFQSYKGKDSIKQILSRPALLERVVGPSMVAAYVSGKDKFTRQVVKSFLNTLVQTLYGSTRDIKEIVRLGRLLWPVYIKPLHSTNIEKTMKTVQKMVPSSKISKPTVQENGKQILAFLDQQILPQIRSKVEHCLFSFAEKEKTQQQRSTATSKHIQQPQTTEHVGSAHSMGYLSKCLLLAAFICQTNRPDKDKQLFTIQKNGKKNSVNKRKSHGEDLAFGSSRNGSSKGYRPRMYPMERMLSVFVSIVGLNQGQQLVESKSQETTGSESITPGSIGSADFFEAMSHLRDIGIIHDKAGRSSSATDTANLVAPKFWSSTTRDEADGVAKSIGFPLDDYLL